MVPFIALGLAVGGLLIAASSKNSKPASRARSRTWQEFERDSCALRGQRHVGGPGRPDCEGDDTHTEVKHWSRPVDLGAVKAAHRRAVAAGKNLEMVSSSGFTMPAEEWCLRRGVKLSRR